MKRWSAAGILLAMAALLLAWSRLLEGPQGPGGLVSGNPPPSASGPGPTTGAASPSEMESTQAATKRRPPRPRVTFGPVGAREDERDAAARPVPAAASLEEAQGAGTASMAPRSVTGPAPGAGPDASTGAGSSRGRISGTVLDSAGRPLAGARLLFGASDLPLEAFSRAGGTYESPPLRPGKVPVFASHPEVQPESRVVSVEPGSAAKLDLKLSPGERLVVRVVSRDGSPVADAEVWTHVETGPPAEAPPAEAPAEKARASEARGAPPRGRGRADAPPVLFAPILPAEGSAVSSLPSLEPPGRSAGEKARALEPVVPEEWKFLGRTGDLGVLGTRRPPGRKASVRARLAGFREETKSIDGAEVSLVLEPAPALRGHAVDAVTGLPVPLAAVRLEVLAGAEHEEAPDRGRLFQSLAPGKFVVGLPPYPGTYRIAAVAEGGLRGESPDVVFDGKAAPGPVIVPLEPRLELAGTVSGPEGPVSGAAVELLLHDGLGARFQKLFGVLVPAPLRVLRETRSDARGHFVFRDAVPGTYRLRARQAGLAELISAPVDLPWDGEYPLVLRRASTLSGTLFDAESVAETGIPILLIAGDDAAHVSWTDSSGKFEFRDLAPGSGYRIAIGDPGGATSEAVHSEILLEEEGARRPRPAGDSAAAPAVHGAPGLPGKSLAIEEGGRIVFDLRRDPSPLGSLDGVVEVDGKPVPGVYVRARRKGDDPPPGGADAVPHEARTDARGEFRLRSLPPGDYVLASGPADPEATARVEAGRRARVELRSRTLRLRLEVIDRARGARFQGPFEAEVKALPDPEDPAGIGETVRARGSDGTIEVAGLRPGKHRVRLRVRGVLHEERVVDLSADAEERLQVEETDDVSLRLLVSPTEAFRGRATVILFKDGREIYRAIDTIDEVVTVPTAGRGGYEIHVRSEDRNARVAFDLGDAAEEARPAAPEEPEAREDPPEPGEEADTEG